jgi:hypothetical protein
MSLFNNTNKNVSMVNVNQGTKNAQSIPFGGEQTFDEPAPLSTTETNKLIRNT